MVISRAKPYIWATWLPRLLTGENSCEWAVWFKAHYQEWTRQTADFDQTGWLLNHRALFAHQRGEWEERGHEVYEENQNAFTLRGQTATRAGKQDLITVSGNETMTVDVKGGQERPCDRTLILIYMYAIPRGVPKFQDVRLRGEIVYPNKIGRVPPGSFHLGLVEELGR